MTTETKTIPITMSWRAAARIYLEGLENGTAEGRTQAREGIMEMADKLDVMVKAGDLIKRVDRDDLQDCQDTIFELRDLLGMDSHACETCGAPPGEVHPPACADAIEAEENAIDVDKIYDDCVTMSEEVMARSKPEADRKGWILVSRGFEMLSLNERGERDENIVDYVDDDALTPEVIQEYIDDVRKVGSAYLAIGWGIDQADDQEGYDYGDYSPMHDWEDLPNIDVR